MGTGFSLTFSAMRVINDYNINPASNKIVRVCQQHLISRIIAISLSALALIDIAYHCCAFVITTIRQLSFEESLTHLKVAMLFRFTLLFGSLFYTLAPSQVKDAFENSFDKFVEGVLLSGSREIFFNGSRAGSTRSFTALSHFYKITESLPESVKKTMQPTLTMLKEARDFRIAMTPLNVDGLTTNTIYKFIDKHFQKFDKLPFAIREVALRVAMVAMAYFSIVLSFAEMEFFLIHCIIGMIGALQFLIGNDDFNLAVGVAPSAKINLKALLRSLCAIPACLTYGLIDPKTIQKLFYSPLVEDDSKRKANAIGDMLAKLVQKPDHASVMFPISTYTSNPETAAASHFYAILVTKLPDKKFRLSILDRGLGFRMIAGERKCHLDSSVENVDLKYVMDHLANVYEIDSFKGARKFYNEHKCKMNKDDPEYLSFLVAMYLPSYDDNVKKFESNHIRSHQKIGNCGISNVLGAVSFHMAMQKGDFQDKKDYKKFVYEFKKLVFKHRYLLNFRFGIRKGQDPIAAASANLARRAKACQR